MRTFAIAAILCIAAVAAEPTAAPPEKPSPDQEIVIRYVADNLCIAKEKQEGERTLETYKDYITYMERLLGADRYKQINPIRTLKVAYDEIWTYKRTEYLTKEEIRASAATLEIWTFYFKGGVLQAHTSEKFFIDSPLSSRTRSTITSASPRYKITFIADRQTFISKASKLQ